jgi:pyruvate dehydrogenase E1 component beta subunit
VFRGPNASAGQLGAQHSQAFESWYANIPGIKVVSVSNPYDAKGLLKSAIRDEDPVVFMESEVMYGDVGEVPEEEYLIPIGKADIKREGTDVTIVSYNKMMKVALGAAEELAKEGISVEVIDLRTIRPLDWHTIVTSVRKTNRLVIVEEQWPFSSVSSEISYRVQKEAFDYLDAPIRRICSADANMHYAPNLVAAFLPDVTKTVKLVREVMYQTK